MSVQTLAIHRIKVQRKTSAAGGFGGTDETWSTHLMVSARVQPLSGMERELYSRETEFVTHKIYVPGAPDIRADDRIIFRGKTYQIRNVRNVNELDHFLTIEAEVQT